MIRTAVIIAAGNGSRFKEFYRPEDFSKPLLKVGGRTLIDRIISTVQGYGIDRFIVITGFNHHLLEAHFSDRHDLDIQLVYNPDWQKPNGLSVLHAAPYIEEPFLLLMADHLFNPSILHRLDDVELDHDEALLLVDHHIEAVYDLDDATKVKLNGRLIADIGKDLSVYDAIDTGIFLCTPAIFTALHCASAQGKYSLSDGVRQLASLGRMRTLDILAGYWQDVDTPEG